MAAAGGVKADATIDYNAQSNSGTDLTTYTFSSISIGTAAGNRTVIISIACHRAYPYTGDVGISSVTIGGSTASNAITSSDGNMLSAIYYLDVSSGTTADIVITCLAKQLKCGIGSYAAYGASTEGIVTNSYRQFSTSSMTLDVTAGSVTVGVSQNNHTNASTSWTGLTKDFGIAPDPNYSGAHVASAAAATLTISCDWPTEDSGKTVAACFKI